LAESYKEKNATLTDLIAQYKAGYEQSQTLREELAESRRAIAQLEKDLAEERENLESLDRNKEEQLRQHEDRNKADLERVVEKRDVEHERVLLRLRTEYQEQLQKANQESTAEIRGLYERIERLRVENDQTVATLRADHQRQITELKKPPKTDKT
jgi:hypothetical protein